MPVVLVHGTLSWGTLAFAAQRPLATDNRLLVVDRRGFGASPDTARSDYEVDADDVGEVLGAGAHLVGHSYGGVVALLAASRFPSLVRSLALIEPAALAMAGSHPAAAASLQALRAAVASPDPSPDPAGYLRLVYPDGPPAPYAWALRAAATALAERPCWEADFPLDAVRAAAYPKLIVTGAWDVAAPGHLATTGAGLMATGSVLASKIGARLVRVPGAAHEPHRERPSVVNGLLRALWQ